MSICPLSLRLESSLVVPNLPPEVLRLCSDVQEVELLQGGAVNQCYRVIMPTGAYAFRLGVADPTKYGFDRREELEFYKEGERLGIAPKLLASDPSQGILIMEYIDGALLDKDAVRKPAVNEKVVALLHTMHAIDAPENSGEGKTIQHIRFFMEALKGHQALLPEWESFIVQAIANIPKSNKLVLCHNDLAFNMLEDKVGRVFAIDFECAGWNYRVFDLAFLCIWYEFSEQEKMELLSSYNEGISLKELNAAICLGLLFSALWSRLEVVYGNDTYQKQAEELYQKATSFVVK